MKSIKSSLLLKICLSTFLLQAFFPVGYMPAALSSGAPVQLCHSVFPLEFLLTLNAQNKSLETSESDGSHAHHAHHHAAQNESNDQLPTPEVSNQEVCVFAALNLDSVLFAINSEVPEPAFTHYYQAIVRSLRIRREHFSYQARAPPSHS